MIDSIPRGIPRLALSVSLMAALPSFSPAENPDLTVARLKYDGGGDWYNDPSAIPNLCREINRRTHIRAALEQAEVDPAREELFRYPFTFLTGHGNISFTERQVKNLRAYLTGGGFLYADDDYGMDEPFRREMRKVFPDRELVEIPFDHPIYKCFYEFPNGLPKIHKHDGKPPRGYGIIREGRMVVFYTYETNISDGWPDARVHNDPPEKREDAFKMGVNIVVYAMTH